MVGKKKRFMKIVKRNEVTFLWPLKSSPYLYIIRIYIYNATYLLYTTLKRVRRLQYYITLLLLIKRYTYDEILIKTFRTTCIFHRVTMKEYYAPGILLLLQNLFFQIIHFISQQCSVQQWIINDLLKRKTIFCRKVLKVYWSVILDIDLERNLFSWGIKYFNV